MHREKEVTLLNSRQINLKTWMKWFMISTKIKKLHRQITIEDTNKFFRVTCQPPDLDNFNEQKIPMLLKLFQSIGKGGEFLSSLAQN